MATQVLGDRYRRGWLGTIIALGGVTLALGALMVAKGRHPTRQPPLPISKARPALGPEGWERIRVGPDQVRTSGGTLRSRSRRLERSTLVWEVPVDGHAGEAQFRVPIPADRRRRNVLWFGVVGRRPAAPVRLAVEILKGKDWRVVEESLIEARAERSVRQRCVEIPCQGETEVRLRLGWEGGSKPGRIRVDQMQFFRLSPSGRNDAWLFAGASITASATFDPERLWALAHDQFAGADPLIMTLAEPGWTTHDLLARLPRFLKAHPQVRYICFNIGGNDISQDRPWPRGAPELHDALVELLETARAAGKIPILGRISYRTYRQPPRVPPSSNGSGPYVEHVFDPLIARYCPAFYDKSSGRGRIDLYGHFRDHPEELSADGVHPTPSGLASWRQIWIRGAGEVLYGLQNPRDLASGKGSSTSTPAASRLPGRVP